MSIQWNENQSSGCARHRGVCAAGFLKRWVGDYMNKVWRWQMSNPSPSAQHWHYNVHVWADVWLMVAYIYDFLWAQYHMIVHADLKESWRQSEEVTAKRSTKGRVQGVREWSQAARGSQISALPEPKKTKKKKFTSTSHYKFTRIHLELEDN